MAGQEPLKLDEEKYRFLIENLKDMFVLFHVKDKLQYVSPCFCNTFGKTQDELLGTSFMPDIHEDDRKSVAKAIASIHMPPYFVKIEGRAMTVNGWRWQEWHHTAILDKNAEVETIAAIGRDIDERKKTEAALKKSQQQFQDLFNSINDLIFTQDMNGYFLSANPALQKLLGYTMDEFIGLRAADFMKPELQAEYDTQYLEALKKQGTIEGVACYFKKNREKIYIEYKSSLVKPRKGEPFITGIGRDVTEKILAARKIKKLQDQIIHAQKMESIGTLAGGIAHDFNNILFPILGHTEMLLHDFPENTPTHDSLKKIYAGGIRARDLVKQILTFSRQTDEDLKLLKIQPVVKEALTLLRSTIPANIEIIRDIDPDCGMVQANPTQIHQIIMNLVTNAYHAMDGKKGKLIVSLKEVISGVNDIITPDMTPGFYACLTISDTGKGMDKDMLHKIFDPFFTTKEKGKGTGMGLSVVHGLVKKMNGDIKVYSEPGMGSEFRVYLPVAQARSQTYMGNSKIQLQYGNEHILLVDDEKDINTMEKQMLERLGYKVTSLTSSIEALEVFRAGPDKFDMVITDMAMPGMAGDELSEQLIKIRSDIPILMCTGFSETMSQKKAESLGIRGFLLKPIVMVDLSGKIRDIFDKP